MFVPRFRVFRNPDERVSRRFNDKLRRSARQIDLGEFRFDALV